MYRCTAGTSAMSSHVLVNVAVCVCLCGSASVCLCVDVSSCVHVRARMTSITELVFGILPALRIA